MPHMRTHVSNASSTGWVNVLAGVLIFSGSLPATRVAVAALDPIFVTLARATVAGILAGAVLLASRKRPPRAREFGSILAVGGGVVIGFPLLTALALRHMTATHSLVFIGILPLVTAVFAVVRGKERQPLLFWLFSLLGASAVAAYALVQAPQTLGTSDLLMLAAVIVCGFGYAEGALLSRTYGGWQVISWALVVTLPVALPLMLLLAPSAYTGVTPAAWASLIYVSLFSMFLGFVFWYRGLALVGTAAGSQLQLLQPFLGVLISALLLRESVPILVVVVMLLVAACVSAARKASR